MTVVEPDAAHPFRAEAAEAEGRLLLRLAGELDAEAAPDLHHLIESLPIEGDTILELERLTFVDTSGLGCLLRLQQRVADAGGLLEAHGACPQVRHAIQMVQLHRVMALLQ